MIDGIKLTGFSGEGVSSALDILASGALLLVAQTSITPSQQAQARSNISALNRDGVLQYINQTLTVSEQQLAQENISALDYNAPVLKYVELSLDSSLKLIARENIGAMDSDTPVLLYNNQQLTLEEQEQSRVNIGTDSIDNNAINNSLNSSRDAILQSLNIAEDSSLLDNDKQILREKIGMVLPKSGVFTLPVGVDSEGHLWIKPISIKSIDSSLLIDTI